MPLLSDNYAWLLTGEGSRDCAVVDPSEGAPVAELIKREGLTLRWILATHHHWDHTGGIEELLRGAEGAEVICSQYDLDARRVPGATRGVKDGEKIEVAGETAACLMVPGHTLGAAAFYFSAAGAVFTGDTLFTAGCGRLFEGTPDQMYESLARLKDLPPDTGVYCGHEYTEKNLRFARDVFPEDAEIRGRLERVREARGADRPTVPETMGVERKTNPFLRADTPKVFAEFRRRRDSF